MTTFPAQVLPLEGAVFYEHPPAYPPGPPCCRTAVPPARLPVRLAACRLRSHEKDPGCFIYLIYLESILKIYGIQDNWDT